MRAEKYLANSEPERDLAAVDEAFANIVKIAPKCVVLISTIDVYDSPKSVTEYTAIDSARLQPYGLHRLQLEKKVEEYFDRRLIIRLPGLYGENLKKNFLFDLMNPLPSTLSEKRFKDFSEKEKYIASCYSGTGNGFYKRSELGAEARMRLEACYKRIGFSAIDFTDSRGKFQFYNLANLWGHVEKAMTLGIPILNLAVEPIIASDLYYAYCGEIFLNEITTNPPDYNFLTQYSSEFGGHSGYITDKDFALADILSFLKGWVRT